MLPSFSSPIVHFLPEIKNAIMPTFMRFKTHNYAKLTVIIVDTNLMPTPSSLAINTFLYRT